MPELGIAGAAEWKGAPTLMVPWLRGTAATAIFTSGFAKYALYAR
jgi:hypothetical protein